VADWWNTVSNVIAMGLWTTWLTTVALTGVFAIWGALEHSGTVAAWVPAISHPGWIFLFGALFTLTLFGVVAKSGKLTFRIQNVAFFVSLGGIIIAILALLFVGNAAYVHHFNTFARSYTHRGDSYEYVIALAKANGFKPGGYTMSDTLGSVYVVLTVSIWAWVSAYLAGEQRGARSVGRQLRVMAGSGSFQILILFLTVVVFLHTAGRDFFESINYLNTIGKNPLPAPPYYTLLAGVVISNPVLAALLVFSFAFNIWCGLSELVLTTTRPLFAYAFDGLMPSKVANVNERTHTPIYAIGVLGLACLGITAYASFSATSFLTLWAYVGLFSFAMLMVTSISAIALPYRRPEDYERSPAKISVLGVPLVVIAGVLSFITCAIYFALIFIYPSVLGSATLGDAFGALGVCTISGLGIFYAAKYSRRNAAVPLEAVFAEIPPE
jgi:amino acid transporter